MEAETGSVATVAAVALIVVMAGLDLLAMVLAKEWTLHRAPGQLAGSIAALAALFVVFLAGLRSTELSIIAFGWIVLVETAIVVIDWAYYGVRVTPARWAAVIAIVALQGYLVLGLSTAESTGGTVTSGTSEPPAADAFGAG